MVLAFSAGAIVGAVIMAIRWWLWARKTAEYVAFLERQAGVVAVGRDDGTWDIKAEIVDEN